MSKRYFLFLFILMHFTVEAKRKYVPDSFPQANFALEANIYNGMIIRHTLRFKPIITEPSFGVELAFYKTCFGKQPFERKFFYPRIGASILAVRFGDNAIFGEAIGIFPHVSFWIKRSRIMDFYFRMGIGLAYLNKPYDYTSNSINNVIGSYLNNVTQFKFGVDWKVTDKTNLNTSFNFTHFSNSRSQSPNLGINYMALCIGVKQNFGVKKHVYNHDSLPKKIQRNFYTVGFGVALDEKVKIAYGPTYQAYNFFAQYHRATSIANHLVGGVSLVYNRGSYAMAQIRENNESKITDRTINSLEGSIYFGDEMVLKDFGFFAQIGIYCFLPYQRTTFMYQKLGGVYYLPAFSKSFKGRMFIGANLKTHLDKAENFELRTGMRF
ncbi:MAG: acyloxyacyl hydrolase [Chitinophagales bacterium]|nr:acyloxyacyl hydrolase [Chitinophagales bacterium]